MSKTCVQCGAELEETAVFCDECGAKQPILQEETKKQQPSQQAHQQRVLDNSSAEPTKSSGMAIASLVCGIVGLVLVCIIIGIIPAILAIIFAGYVLKNNKPGRNMAIVGLITGIIATCLGIIFLFV